MKRAGDLMTRCDRCGHGMTSGGEYIFESVPTTAAALIGVYGPKCLIIVALARLQKEGLLTYRSSGKRVFP